MIRKVMSVARFTLISNFRNRIFWILVLFGVMILGSSVLFGMLGQEQEQRMLMDLGLASIEFLSFLAAVFLMVNLILEEVESKSIYLVLTRAISRHEYLAGKFIGALSSVALCYISMSIVHLAVLLAKGWRFSPDGNLYLISLILSFEKIILISSISLFLSLFASSGVTAMVFTFFIWITGHFVMEMRFLISRIDDTATRWVFKAVYYMIPHFQFLNARDLWSLVSGKWLSFVLEGTGYALLYSAIVFAGSILLFRRKEF